MEKGEQKTLRIWADMSEKRPVAWKPGVLLKPDSVPLLPGKGRSEHEIIRKREEQAAVSAHVRPLTLQMWMEPSERQGLLSSFRSPKQDKTVSLRHQQRLKETARVPWWHTGARTPWSPAQIHEGTDYREKCSHTPKPLIQIVISKWQPQSHST